MNLLCLSLVMYRGSQHPVITNTTVEVVVPSSLVPSIYGEDGGCLRQMRQVCHHVPFSFDAVM